MEPLVALVLRAWCFVEPLKLFLRFAAPPRLHRWGWWCWGRQLDFALQKNPGLLPAAADAEELGRKTFKVGGSCNPPRGDATSLPLLCSVDLGRVFVLTGAKARSLRGDDPAPPISSAKKVRRLSLSPTETSLPGGS